MNTDSERLSRLVVRRLNRELAASGLKICAECQGHPQPLDEEHFYRSHGYFMHVCKRCQKQRAVQCQRERYATDAAFREYRKALARDWIHSHPEYAQAYERERAARRKAAKLAAVLEKVQP